MQTVPLQDPARAAAALEYAIRDLEFRGAFIGTNVNGRYYNSAEFDPFWAKAQELGVLVVIHPEHIAGAERMTEYASTRSAAIAPIHPYASDTCSTAVFSTGSRG